MDPNLEPVFEPEPTPEPPYPPNENIKTTLDGFVYTDADLTEDGIFTAEAQLRHLAELDAKQQAELASRDPVVQHRIQMTKRVICIAMKRINKPLLYSTYLLTPQEREQVKLILEDYSENKTQEEIIDEFNAYCNSELFTPKFDYSRLPVYDA